jgi:hypothetical protein
LSSGTIWSPILNDREIGHEESLSQEQIIGFVREVEARMAIKSCAASTASARLRTICGAASSAA